jgi:alcohol dehydrogenase
MKALVYNGPGNKALEERSKPDIAAPAEEDALVVLSDILPTGFECGVLNGKVEPGATVAIVGAGPIGLAALLTAQFYSPAEIIMVDMDDNRLQMATRFGATIAINNKDGKASHRSKAVDHASFQARQNPRGL